MLSTFEATHGTFATIALFIGPLSTVPGLLYVLICRQFLSSATNELPICSSSVWVMLLLSSACVSSAKRNPYFSLSIPTAILSSPPAANGGLGPAGAPPSSAPLLPPDASKPFTIKIPTWTAPLGLLTLIYFLLWFHLSSSIHPFLLLHLCSAAIGYAWGLGLLNWLKPSERLTRWLERRLKLLARVPHYVSVDRQTYGRYGALPVRMERGGEGARVEEYGLGTGRSSVI